VHLLSLALAGCGGGCDAQQSAPDAGTSASSSSGADAGAGGSTPIVADCNHGWCTIPAGTFIMGAPEGEWGRGAQSQDQVQVTLTRSFLIQQHELTQAEWVGMRLTNPSGNFPDGTGNCLAPDCPVGNVSWYEAIAFANLMSTAQRPPLKECYVLDNCSGELGKQFECTSVSLTAPDLYACEGFRLPTEAEWEYAVRAGTTTAFYSGDIAVYDIKNECQPDANLEPIGWYCYNSAGQTHPVGLMLPNGWGLFDMSGNVFEWVHDEYTPGGYGDGPLVDPDGHMNDDWDRVMRGGAFNAYATLLRSAEHLSGSANGRGPSIGFRLVRTFAAK
jgi:formylglycine-generating enzyme required for sulfatase activity